MKIFKIIIFWIGILFLLLVCTNKISTFIIKYLLNFNFDSILVKVLYGIIAVAGFIFLISKSKIPNPNCLINSLCICVIYAIFRFHIVHLNGWDFAPLFGRVKYADTIVFLFISSAIPYCKVALKNKKNSNECTIPNNAPIELPQNDLFGYTDDARNLLSIIIKNRSRAENGAIVIGLTGKWGQGKTSYLNLMRNAAETHQDIVFTRINVWQSNGYKDMVKKLLSAIANGMNDLPLQSIIHDYTQAIIDADISYLSKAIALLFGKKSKQPEVLFNEVGEKIRKLNKIIIVQIDDLDRLTSEEILYTLKLIRNIANFKNTFFIVAYDDEYIREQLGKLNIPDTYTEKIFNAVYPLPSVRKADAIELIKKELTQSLLIDADIKGIVDIFMETIDYKLSLRNAKRLATSIQCGISKLKDAEGDIMIDLLDYMLVQYLHQVNSTAYDFLANFTNNESFFNNEKCISLNGTTYTLNIHSGFFKDRKQLTEEEYKQQRLSRDVSDHNIELTYKIFKTLFGTNRNAILGIAYVNAFPLYFNRVFDKKLIYKKEFLNSFRRGTDVFKNDLQQWFANNDKFVLTRLIDNHQCNSLDEWLQFFESILCIMPKTYIDFLWRRNEHGAFIPTPGRDAPTAEFYNSIYIFFFETTTLEADSIETLQKKFALLISNKRAYTENISSYTGKAISDKTIFELYWNQYIAKGGSYKNFDEDFWYFIDDIFGQDKLELRKIATEHIEMNICDFIQNYSIPEIINNPNLHFLFSEYVVTATNSAQSRDIWKPHFRDFLYSIKTKSPILLKYIEDFEQHMS